jgi:hypothetical protein
MRQESLSQEARANKLEALHEALDLELRSALDASDEKLRTALDASDEARLSLVEIIADKKIQHENDVGFLTSELKKKQEQLVEVTNTLFALIEKRANSKGQKNDKPISSRSNKPNTKKVSKVSRKKAIGNKPSSVRSVQGIRAGKTKALLTTPNRSKINQTGIRG